MATIIIAQDGVYAGAGRLVRHSDGTVTIEDCSAILGPPGLDHASGEQQATAERAYAAIERAIAAGESSVTIDGCTYSWAVEEPPAIEVLGLGADDWGAEADPEESEEERRRREAAREWERYGTVRVRVGEVEYQVGCAIGVPAYLRATAEAAGGDMITPYLSAWYVARVDWSCAPASSGPDGVPADLADDVLAEIYEARHRLWREYQEERANEIIEG